MRTYVVVLLLALGLNGTAKAESTACTIRTENDPQVEKSLGKYEVRYFTTEISPTSILSIVNDTGYPISKITAVMEFFEPDDRRMLSIVFQATTKDMGNALGDLESRAYTFLHLPRELVAGERIEIMGSSPITSGRCPATARMSLLHIVFLDRREISWSLPSVELDPVIRDGPNNAAIRLAPGTEVLTRTVVGQNGRVKEATALRAEDEPHMAAIRGEIASWTLAPAMRSGQAVDSELILLFLVANVNNELSWKKAVHDLSSQALTVVVFQPHASGIWTATYGDRRVLKGYSRSWDPSR